VDGGEPLMLRPLPTWI